MALTRKQQWEAARIIFEARKREAWGDYADVIIARTPWQKHDAHPLVAADHELALAEIKALCEKYDITEK